MSTAKIKAGYSSNKSYIRFAVEDYLNYVTSSFDRAVVYNKGLAYKIFAYLERRNKLIFLPIFKTIYNIFYSLKK